MKKILLLTLMTAGLSTLYGADIRDLEDKINKLSDEIANIKTEIIISEDKISFFDLSKETTIDKINTNAGDLYVQITDVATSGDGYTAKVHIGNPLYANFKNLTITFTWRSSNEWIKRSVNISELLAPSSWITTDIILSPVKAREDITAVLMSIDVGNVELLNR